MFEMLVCSSGTPSTYVVMAGLPGPELMPRNRAKLSLRAWNSEKKVFGVNGVASLIEEIAQDDNVSAGTAVMLAGTVCASAGSFSAVTTTGGASTRNGLAPCAAATVARPSSRIPATHTESARRKDRSSRTG